MKFSSLLKNKYLLTSLCFVVWIVFFDERDVIGNLKRNQELKALEKSRDYYTAENKKIKKELDQLEKDAATMEKYAREKFHMKRDNEDLFIIPEKSN